MKKNLVKCFFMAAGILSLSGAAGMLTQAQIVDGLVRDLHDCAKLAVEGPGSRYWIEYENALVLSLCNPDAGATTPGSNGQSVSDEINSTLAIEGENSEFAAVLNYVVYGYLVNKKPLVNYLSWYNYSDRKIDSVALRKAQLLYQLDKVAASGYIEGLSKDAEYKTLNDAVYIFDNALYFCDITDSSWGRSIADVLLDWLSVYEGLSERSRGFVYNLFDDSGLLGSSTKDLPVVAVNNCKVFGGIRRVFGKAYYYAPADRLTLGPMPPADYCATADKLRLDPMLPNDYYAPANELKLGSDASYCQAPVEPLIGSQAAGGSEQKFYTIFDSIRRKNEKKPS
ncbi:MAG: hypothetical protein LBJ45_00155 [Holosporaceae bacterium]|jgi:hypothetical protein|nr:hypothetical protein [Holosporaceae bacterium]